MLPSSELSKNQINRLGDRLRTGDVSESDLRLLDTYRRSFTAVYEDVVGLIRDQLRLEPTGRPATSTTSIIEKLRRERTKLSRMQDIAGCRLTVADTMTQDEVVTELKGVFERAKVVDRREHSSHGYRAVHIIVPYSGKLIEVQVRTSLQHLWAELSEKLSDIVNSAIKYGGGDEDAVRVLMVMSETIKAQEAKETWLLGSLLVNDPQGDSDEIYSEELKTRDIMSRRVEIERFLKAIGEVIPRLKGRKDDLSD
jgi:putative GTP pyrophosphokinase